MKKILAFLLSAVLLLSLVGCDAIKKPQSEGASLAEQYLAAAQDAVKENDIQLALDILNEGISVTNDEALKQYLAELESTDAPTREEPAQAAEAAAQAAPAALDLSAYSGTWTDGTCTTLNIGGQSFDIMQTSSSDRIAMTEGSFPAQLDGNTYTYSYAEDGWGNSGTLTFTFENGAIRVNSVVTSRMPGAMWSFGEGEHVLKPATPALTLDGETQYRANLFLSNFSEQGFSGYDRSTPDSTLVQFAFTYNRINQPERITHNSSDYTMRISSANIDSTLNYFFGKTVPHPSTTAWISYQNGEYYEDEGGGEYCGYFTVVDSLDRQADGTYCASFTVYEWPWEIYENGALSNYYHYSAQQAAGDGNLSRCYTGSAVLQATTRSDGVLSFYLREYTCY